MASDLVAETFSGHKMEISLGLSALPAKLFFSQNMCRYTCLLKIPIFVCKISSKIC